MSSLTKLSEIEKMLNRDTLHLAAHMTLESPAVKDMTNETRYLTLVLIEVLELAIRVVNPDTAEDRDQTNRVANYMLLRGKIETALHPVNHRPASEEPPADGFRSVVLAHLREFLVFEGHTTGYPEGYEKFIYSTSVLAPEVFRRMADKYKQLLQLPTNQ